MGIRSSFRTVLLRAGAAGLLLLGSLALALLVGPAAASAANVGFSQCNDVGAGPSGATTGMTCDVTIVNTIDGATRGSTVTVTRQCSLDPCPEGNGGPTTTSSTDLVTSVSQCNGSGNDAAHTTTCTVHITNNISSDTPGATPVSGVTVNQCNGSAQGGGGSNTCDPFPANTTGADITQCNGSANGGGGTIDCSVPAGSTVSPALPVTINQCNGTGNPGGSTVRCTAQITTNITPPSSSGGGGGSSGTTGASGGSTGAGGGTTAGTGGTTGGAAGSTGSTRPRDGQVTDVPVGGVAAGGGTSAVPARGALFLTGLAMLLGAAFLVLRRCRTSQPGSPH
jgi:hypothetical protein